VPPVSVELKRTVKSANDIVDVVAEYIPVHPAGKSYKALCPFHNDTHPSLTIDRNYQNYRCWACGARGDVFDFVMNMDKVSFGEALRMLAERAGIELRPEQARPEDQARARLLQVMRWAQEQYQQCLLESPLGVQARQYIGSRKLAGAMVRQFGLGFSPIAGDWLVQLARREQISLELLEQVGLIAPRGEDRGYYDRFRDRVMFPIRDVRGQTVGFGGRILPDSALAARSPKYYNSSDTPLFNKSDLLFGLDLARHPGSAAGVLVVVEGYTDVIMAHQSGIANVVATMGTALSVRHVTQLRRYVPKVILVFDGDSGGATGVDRALELFVSQDVELAIAALPDGLDPCDLLCQPGGPEQFQRLLAAAQDALEFKLNQLLQQQSMHSVDGSRRIVDAILGVMALTPRVPNQAGQVRQELIITRLAHRFGLRQETVWARFGELRQQRSSRQASSSLTAAVSAATAVVPNSSRPRPIERQLLELLLAEPVLVAEAAKAISPSRITHSGLRRLLEELYDLYDRGERPDIDALRVRLLDRPDLAKVAMDFREVGEKISERSEWFQQLLRRFDAEQTEAETRALKEQLSSGAVDQNQARELLRRLQSQLPRRSVAR
jgi:DNA primase